MLKLLLQNKYLLLILVVGLALRLYGINHGFPFIYNVDEPALVRSATQIRFDSNPAHFDWPHLHFYLNFLLFTGFSAFRSVLQVLGISEALKAFAPILWRDPLIFYLLARIFNALIGTSTVLVIYFIGKSLFEKKYGLFAALALAVFPYHVWASHFALIDVPMTFWFSLSLLFSTYIFQKGDLRYYLLAGLFAGFSASTKYNGGFAVLVIFLSHVLLLRKRGLLTVDWTKLVVNKYSRNLLAAAAVSVAGFFLGTPYALLDYKTFSIDDSPKGAYWQFKNVGKVGYSEYFDQLGDVLTVRFVDEFGYTFLFIFEAYILYFIFLNRTKERLLILIPGIFYFLYVTSFDKNRIHYYMLTFPFMVLMTADISMFFLEKFKTKAGVLSLPLLITLVFSVPLAVSVSKVNFISQSDTRNIVSSWMSQNIKPEDSVFYSGSDLDVIMSDTKTKEKKLGSLSSSQLASGDLVVVASNQRLDEVANINSLVSKGSVLFSIENNRSRPGPNIYVFKIN